MQELVALKQKRSELVASGKRILASSGKYLSETEMTMQPNNGSIIINTLSHETESHILEDLPYLNYIKKEGLVVDLEFRGGIDRRLERDLVLRHVVQVHTVDLKVHGVFTIAGGDKRVCSESAAWSGKTARCRSSYASRRQHCHV